MHGNTLPPLNFTPLTAHASPSVKWPLASVLAGMILGLLAVPATRAQPIVGPSPAPAAPAPGATAPSGDVGTPNLGEPTLPTSPTAPSTVTLTEPADGAVLSVEPVEGSPSSVLPKWKFNLGFEAKAYYNDNIFIKPTNEAHDFVFELAPYIELAWGDYRDKEGSFGGLKYTATGRHYDQHDSLDKVDHDAVLQLQIQLAKTQLNFDFVYKSLSTADFDLASLTQRQIFSGVIGAEYQFTGKTSLEVTVSGAMTDYDKGLDNQTYFGNLWLNSYVKPKLRLDLGVEAGSLKQQGASEQTYGRVLLRGRYLLTEKLSLRGHVGLDYREFDGGKFNVVGGLGLTYNPRVTTQFSLDVGRTISASGSTAGSNILATTVVARFHQEVFQRIRLSLAAGYTNADYAQASFITTGAQSRNDNIYFVTPEISYRIRHWLAFSVFYTYSKNDSTRDSVSFEDNIVGIRLNGDY